MPFQRKMVSLRTQQHCSVRLLACLVVERSRWHSLCYVGSHPWPVHSCQSVGRLATFEAKGYAFSFPKPGSGVRRRAGMFFHLCRSLMNCGKTVITYTKRYILA